MTTIKMSRLKGYKDYSGDGAAPLLPFDGFVRLLPEKFEVTETRSDKPKPMVKWTLTLAEDDLPPHTLYAQTFIGGDDRNDKAMERQFATVMTSSGLWTEEDINKMAENDEDLNVEETAQAICDAAKNDGVVVYGEIQKDTYKGKSSSRINNFVTRAVFEERVEKGKARIERNDSGASSSSGSSTPSAAPSNAAASALDAAI